MQDEDFLYEPLQRAERGYSMRELLELLEHDARRPVGELASMLKRSEYEVENIIRVGSAGALQDNLKLMDVILAQGACTTSSYIDNFKIKGTFAPLADFELLLAAKNAAKELGIDVHIGNLLSSDNFYSAFEGGAEENRKWQQMGVLGVEMEAAGLYANAAYFGKRALCICTVSDHIFRPETLPPEDRQLGFTQMIRIALDTAAAMG